MMRIYRFSFTLLVLLCACTKNNHYQNAQQELGFALNSVKTAPQFSGTNFTRHIISQDEFRAKVWVAYFMFTSCSGPCPVLSSKIRDLQQKYSDQNINFVAFTVDPENDTEQVLADYATKYSAQPNVWYLLRMSVDSVKKLAGAGFMIGSPDDPILHSTRFVLVDKQSIIRGFFDGTDAHEVEKLDKAIAFLLKE